MRRTKQKRTKMHSLCWLAAAVLCCMQAGTPFSAYGADSSVIEKVSVSVKTTYGEQEEIPEPEITVSGSNYSLQDVQFQKEYEKWKPGKNVRVELTLQAEEGKYFPSSLNRSACKVSGAEYVSAKALDETTLQVKVDYKPVTVLGDTAKAGWSDKTQTKAVWKAVEYAPGYSLVLYGDDKVVKRLTVETNNADLSSYMSDIDKTYYYEVKAIPVTSDQKKYLKEGNFVGSTDQDIIIEETASQTSSSSYAGGDGGSFKGMNYVMPDGSMARNIWKKLDGKWYFFDANGNRSVGWTNVGGAWYYMDGTGAVCSGWQFIDGSWYYLGSSEDGARKTGWIEPNPGRWYYLNENGAMASGWQFINGSWYYLGAPEDGQMKTGWIQLDGVWYYLTGSGAMAANTTIDGWMIGADGAALR